MHGDTFLIVLIAWNAVGEVDTSSPPIGIARGGEHLSIHSQFCSNMLCGQVHQI